MRNLHFSVRHFYTFFFLYCPISLRSFNHPLHPFWPLMSFASLQPNEAPFFCSSASDMALSSCFSHSHFSFNIECSRRIVRSRPIIQKGAQSFSFSPKSSCQLFGQSAAEMGDHNWSFVGGSTLAIRPNFTRFFAYTKRSPISASWLTNPQIASSVFTLGTAAVLPFYTLMVVAPKSNLTRKSMESSVPYVVLGLLYVYLLYLSWTPNTIRLMFASKYLLPELSGIAQMFSSEMTLASAWIHLLAVDLFAARQVYQDGLENGVETRHSVSFCLLFCPVGIVTHIITKALTKSAGSTGHGI